MVPWNLLFFGLSVALCIVSSDAKPNTIPAYLPPNLKKQSTEERNYLELYKCGNAGEAYSAAYLTTRNHVEQHCPANYDLKMVNCEMASFLMMVRNTCC